jgi:hypothetical protein
MAFFLWIRPLQEPFDFGLDDKARCRIIFNVTSRKTPSTTFIEELAKVLQTALVGVYGETIFGGSLVSLPDTAGPFVTIIESSGLAPLYTHNSPSPSYQQPSAQITIRAADYAVARATARAAYDALAAVNNATVTP